MKTDIEGANKDIGSFMKYLSSLQQAAGSLNPQGNYRYSNRSLTPSQATGNALAPGFDPPWYCCGESLILNVGNYPGRSLIPRQCQG
jgi:hypothetical protein